MKHLPANIHLKAKEESIEASLARSRLGGVHIHRLEEVQDHRGRRLVLDLLPKLLVNPILDFWAGKGKQPEEAKGKNLEIVFWPGNGGSLISGCYL